MQRSRSPRVPLADRPQATARRRAPTRRRNVRRDARGTRWSHPTRRHRALPVRRAVRRVPAPHRLPPRRGPLGPLGRRRPRHPRLEPRRGRRVPAPRQRREDAPRARGRPRGVTGAAQESSLRSSSAPTAPTDCSTSSLQTPARLLARLIADYGAPALNWKGLRSTCSTYLTNAPGIYGAASAFLAARQQKENGPPERCI